MKKLYFSVLTILFTLTALTMVSPMNNQQAVASRESSGCEEITDANVRSVCEEFIEINDRFLKSLTRIDSTNYLQTYDGGFFEDFERKVIRELSVGGVNSGGFIDEYLYAFSNVGVNTSEKEEVDLSTFAEFLKVLATFVDAQSDNFERLG